MIIGSHVQMKAPDFVEGSVKEAVSYGANALMLYTDSRFAEMRFDFHNKTERRSDIRNMLPSSIFSRNK